MGMDSKQKKETRRKGKGNVEGCARTVWHVAPPGLTKTAGEAAPTWTTVVCCAICCCGIMPICCCGTMPICCCGTMPICCCGMPIC